MSETKYLDKAGLTYFWGKVKDYVTDELDKKQDTLIFDDTPTDKSTNPVTSGGIKTYVDKGLSGKVYSSSPFRVGEIVVGAENEDNKVKGSTVFISEVIKGLSVNGTTITYTKGDGSTGTITTQDTNDAVTQTLTPGDNANYEVLFSYTAGAGHTTESARKSRSLTFNPSTGTLTATEFKGNLTGNVTGTLMGLAQKATQDGSGNVITSTYETKANAITGLSASGATITYTKGDGNTGTITVDDSTKFDKAGGTITGNVEINSGSGSGTPLYVQNNQSAYVAVFGQDNGVNGLYFTTTSIRHLKGVGAVSNTLQFPSSGNYTYTLPQKTGTLATQTDVNEAISALGDVLIYKGTVETYDDLPEEPATGDVYNVTAACEVYNNDTNEYDSYPAGTNFAWNSDDWDALGGVIDLSGYQLKSDLVAITTGEIDGICTA